MSERTVEIILGAEGKFLIVLGIWILVGILMTVVTLASDLRAEIRRAEGGN